MFEDAFQGKGLEIGKIVEEDNDPKLSIEWKSENSIQQLDWPSQSPDANPVKIIWGYIKHKSLRKKYGRSSGLCDKFVEECTVNLVESTPQRYQYIIESDRKHTNNSKLYARFCLTDLPSYRKIYWNIIFK